MNENPIWAFFFGVVCGVCLLTMLIASIPDTWHAQAKVAIAECEKSLPRDQHCKLTAVRKE